MKEKLVRIGIFYDGNYFYHVSNYYYYYHLRKQRLNISGLHNFIRHKVSEVMEVNYRFCQIVDSHYFRGRLSAQEANQKDILYGERVFDDILMSEGITTHYLPLKSFGEIKQEKGIDVWLALEAFELAIYKRFDILVLIASDGDYVPLVRKLNTLGTSVMVLGWDFESMTESGQIFATKTSQDLLEEATYPIIMQEIIDNRLKKSDDLINNLFVKIDSKKNIELSKGNNESNQEESKIVTINQEKGFGFIQYSPDNLFFHFSSVCNTNPNELKVDNKVEFTISKGDKGDYATNVKLRKD